MYTQQLLLSHRFINIYTWSFIIVFVSDLGGPKGQVVSDELHDGRGIFILVLWEIFDVSDSLIEG